MSEIASIIPLPSPLRNTASVNQQHASDETSQEHAFASDHELVTTLFDLGRQVASVLDFDELLRQIPKFIRRLIDFEAFAVYLLDEKRAELRVAYAVGYPDNGQAATLRLGQGLVGTAA